MPVITQTGLILVSLQLRHATWAKHQLEVWPKRQRRESRRDTSRDVTWNVTEKVTDRQTDRQTDRAADRGADRKSWQTLFGWTGVRGLTLEFWISLRMCSKQLLFRKTACRTGLSGHCRISGTAAKNDNKEDVDSSYLSDTGEIDSFASTLIETVEKKGESFFSGRQSWDLVDVVLLSIWLWSEIWLSSQLCRSCSSLPSGRFQLRSWK